MRKNPLTSIFYLILHLYIKYIDCCILLLSFASKSVEDIFRFSSNSSLCQILIKFFTNCLKYLFYLLHFSGKCFSGDHIQKMIYTFNLTTCKPSNRKITSNFASGAGGGRSRDRAGQAGRWAGWSGRCSVGQAGRREGWHRLVGRAGGRTFWLGQAGGLARWSGGWLVGWADEKTLPAMQRWLFDRGDITAAALAILPRRLPSL